MLTYKVDYAANRKEYNPKEIQIIDACIISDIYETFSLPLNGL